MHCVRPDGRLLVNTRVIEPLPVLIGVAQMPEISRSCLAEERAILIDAEALACEAGSPKSANIVLMGALSTGLEFAEELWRDVISARVPRKDRRGEPARVRTGREACWKGECMR